MSEDYQKVVDDFEILIDEADLSPRQDVGH